MKANSKTDSGVSVGRSGMFMLGVMLLLLGSCSARIHGLPLLVAGGQVTLAETAGPGKAAGQEGWSEWLVPGQALPDGNVELGFVFANFPRDFACEVAGEAGASQVLAFSANLDPAVYKPGDSIILRVPLTIRNGTCRFRYLATPPGDLPAVLTGIRLDPASAFMLDCREASEGPGRGTTWEVRLPADLGSREGLPVFSLARPDGQALVAADQALLITSDGASPGQIQLGVADTVTLGFGLRPGPGRDLAIPGVFLQAAGRIAITGPAAPPRFRVSVFGATGHAGTAPVPLPADPELVLKYPAASWRRPDWEVFRWDANPTVLLLDYASTDVQDRYLKRLAFFVEKKGFKGRLLANSLLEGKHGWNANNFRPEDLADFFNAARDTGFTLNPEEQELAGFLVSWNILTQEPAGAYRPGSGGIISVARGMDTATRRLLLNHEALHGLFYSSSRLQETSARLWEGLAAVPKAFLTRYFDYYQYDVRDAYLMVNEFQAYLMQQSVQAIPEFLTRMAKRLGKDNEADLRRYDEAAGQSLEALVAAAASLRQVVRQEFGLQAGDVGMLERAYRSR